MTDRMPQLIEKQLVTLFTNNEGLDDIKFFLVGEPENIPQHFFPVVMLRVLDRDPLEEATGLLHYLYQVQIAVETNIPDDLHPSADEPRRIDIHSHTSTSQYLSTLVSILENNRALGDLLDEDENERVVNYVPGSKEYFIRARPDGFTNRGEYQFQYKTQKNVPVA